ncbi:dihydroflavonol-4-reductase [Annulohypoxylon truncatum]|uniref:dihydroflavonol-4-reductase n=1 Tax=Annulohypoxylon truncatum TaxID=327061 RepID=UPI0020085FE4|nr:dihydroflavonol-4-reductase [Annulohypoxylon truncatum]KAI1206328.1 dihydroflavonol-4-reductase [Annulohypoxylon truncatum]
MGTSRVLVTGATGLVGSHVVDNLLNRGIKVRAAARSKQKADLFLASRLKFASLLEFFLIDDLTTPGIFNDAVVGVDGIIHIASPLNYSVDDYEKDLIQPAIQGVRSILQAATQSDVKRIVITSSFGAVLDMAREESLPWVYSSNDWNPITLEEAIAPTATPQDAYRASKKMAEKEAWGFVEDKKPQFDLVTLCPSMVFGPLANAPSSIQALNESNKLLWKVASSGVSAPLPPCRFNFWIDVRDLAEIHVQSLLNESCGGKRYMPVAPEPFTYQMASEIMKESFPKLQGKISSGTQEVKTHISADMELMMKDFPTIKYKTFRETVVDFIDQISPLL